MGWPKRAKRVLPNRVGNVASIQSYIEDTPHSPSVCFLISQLDVDVDVVVVVVVVVLVVVPSGRPFCSHSPTTLRHRPHSQPLLPGFLVRIFITSGSLSPIGLR